MIPNPLLTALALLTPLTTSLSIHRPSSLLQPPSLNLNTTTTPALTLTPWPPTPFHFSIPALPLMPTYRVQISAYGAPGPSNTSLAQEILLQLRNKIHNGGSYRQVLVDEVEGVEGVQLELRSTGLGAGGMSRLQVVELVRRLGEETGRHGAMGVMGGAVRVGGVVVTRWRMDWLFE